MSAASPTRGGGECCALSGKGGYVGMDPPAARRTGSIHPTEQDHKAPEDSWKAGDSLDPRHCRMDTWHMWGLDTRQNVPPVSSSETTGSYCCPDHNTRRCCLWCSALRQTNGRALFGVDGGGNPNTTNCCTEPRWGVQILGSWRSVYSCTISNFDSDFDASHRASQVRPQPAQSAVSMLWQGLPGQMQLVVCPPADTAAPCNDRWCQSPTPFGGFYFSLSGALSA